MTAEQVAHAFEKYHIIENPNSGKVDSFGLGLPITKQLVELQKGTISIKSQPNVGTKVILKFPYQQISEVSTTQTKRAVTYKM